ncbi:unnamed protein product [Blepharisma stoltei]|uniref:DOP1 N-terminal domain-containing protein n=1 Tax=Blepharisma stoltei TaxID=1481888 RepID=A0AAU9KE35_9CILI|nr:unnamed protein product [Blepharisma stoltei]
MEQEFYDSLQKCFNQTKNSRSWQWIDLIAWLQGAKKIIEAHKDQRFPTGILHQYSKFLSQCLMPNQSEEVHKLTLSIYKHIFHEIPLHQYHILSAGFFPFFQFASASCKNKFMQIIESVFLPEISNLKHIFFDLISCLLSGSVKLPKVFQRVSQTLDILAVKMKQDLYGSIWLIVLKSSKSRSAALQFLHSRFDMESCEKELMIKALAEAIEDKDKEVKRSVLNLIRRIYPLESDNYIYPELKILVKSVLRQTKMNGDFIVRISEWLCSNDFEDEIDAEKADFLAACVREIFKENLEIIKKNENSISAKNCTVDLLEYIYNTKPIKTPVLDRISLDIVTYFYRLKAGIHGKALNVTRNLNHMVFWELFFSLFENNIRLHSQKVLRILRFSMSYIECNSEIINVIIEKLLAICIESPEFIEILIDDIEILSNNNEFTNKSIANLSFYLFMNTLTDQKYNLQIIEKIKSILVRFHGIGADFHEHLPQLYNLKPRSTEILLLVYNALIDLKGEILSIPQLIQLWTLIETKHKETACNLLIEYSKISEKVWLEALISLLQKPNTAKGLRIFIEFWKISSENHMEALSSVLGNGEVVFFIIECLNDESPLIRHLAKEWVFSSDKVIPFTMDPILAIIFSQASSQYLSCDSLDKCESENIEKFIKSFKTLQGISKIGGKNIWSEINAQDLSEKALSLESSPLFQRITYGDLIVLRCFEFMENMNLDVEKLNWAICNALEEISDYMNPELAFRGLTCCANVLIRALGVEASSVQIYMLILMKKFIKLTKKAPNPYEFRTILNSELLWACLCRGPLTSDKNLRSYWLHFIKKIPGLSILYLDGSNLHQTMANLIRLSCQLAEKYRDENVILLIKKVLHSSLNIKNLNVNEKIPALMTMVFKDLENYLKLCIKLYNNPKNNYDLKYHAQIAKIFDPIMDKYPFELTKGIAIIWIKFCLSAQESKNFVYIVRLIQSFRMDIDLVFDNIFAYFQKEYLLIPDSTSTDGRELCVAHFLNSLFLNFDSLKISIKTQQNFWIKCLKVLKLLSFSRWEEMGIFIVNILYILKSRVHTMNLYTNPRLVKELHCIVQKVFSQALSICNAWARDAYHMPYPGFEEDGDKKLFKIFMKTLMDKGYEIVCLAYPDELSAKIRADCLANVCLRMIALMPEATLSVDLASELILAFLNKEGANLGKIIGKEVINFIINPKFFEVCRRFPSSLETWSKIIILTSLLVYPSHEKTLENITFRIASDTWSLFANPTRKIGYVIKNIAFLMYSGAKDDYFLAIDSIAKYLATAMEDEKYYEVSFLLIRVAFSRFTDDNKMQFWVKIYPRLYIALFSILKSSSPINILAALKLLECLVISRIFSFQTIQWAFILDVNKVSRGGQMDKFIPLIAENVLFLKDIKVSSDKNNRENTRNVMKRKLKLWQAKIDDLENGLEDVKEYAKVFIEDCMMYNCSLWDADIQSLDDGIAFDLLNIQLENN